MPDKPNLNNLVFDFDKLTSLEKIQVDSVRQKAIQDSMALEAIKKEEANIASAAKDAKLHAILGTDIIQEDYDKVKKSIEDLYYFNQSSEIDDLIKQESLLGEEASMDYGQPGTAQTWFGWNEWDDKVMTDNWYTYRKMMNIGGDLVPPMNALGFLKDDSPERRAYVEKIGGKRALKAYVNMVERIPVIHAERQAMKDIYDDVHSQLYRKNPNIKEPSDAIFMPNFVSTKEHQEYLDLKNEVYNNVDLFTKLYGTYNESPSFYEDNYEENREAWIEKIMMEIENDQSALDIERLNDEFKTSNALNLIQNNPTK